MESGNTAGTGIRIGGCQPLDYRSAVPLHDRFGVFRPVSGNAAHKLLETIRPMTKHLGSVPVRYVSFYTPILNAMEPRTE